MQGLSFLPVRRPTCRRVPSVTIDAALHDALTAAFTRPVPKSAGAQVRYLVRQHGGTRAVAALLGVSQRTVERYAKGQIKRPRAELAARMTAEVRRRWQPQVRARARKAASTSEGLMIDVRARFGFTAAPGSTDDARLRHLTLALPPHQAARLLDAQAAGATDRELQRATADVLGEVYFRDGGQRAQGLDVELTDIERIAFEL
ncbi:telomere-protecting terminal protein Tpg [Streptomyces omiyaensis]|uniref:telomere-protecting terminal protein Tpg n=1 Tax=Streptomyces omiyaensis TaxID=68247 RepID=UPI0036F7B587